MWPEDTESYCTGFPFFVDPWMSLSFLKNNILESQDKHVVTRTFVIHLWTIWTVSHCIWVDTSGSLWRNLASFISWYKTTKTYGEFIVEDASLRRGYSWRKSNPKDQLRVFHQALCSCLLFYFFLFILLLYWSYRNWIKLVISVLDWC